MWIKPSQKLWRSGAGLLEQLVTVSIGSGIAVIIITLFVTSMTQVTGAMAYCEMSTASQTTLDYLTRDIRKANRLTASTSNSLQLEDSDKSTITYTYNSREKTFSRTKGARTTILLRECNSMTFTLGKRNPNASFNSFPPATPAECKVIGVIWQCARPVNGRQAAHENVSTGKIVIRRQGT
jgi:hypothetical protein